MALRGLSVGIDTISYYNSFSQVRLLNVSRILDAEIEHGYRLLEFVVGRVFVDYQYLLAIVAVLFVGVVSYHVLRYSSSPVFSYVLFVVYGFYSFAMSATRQTIAIAVVMLAYEQIKQRNLIRYLFFILVASSFHLTALIFLPCYWVNRMKLSMANIAFMILAAIAIAGLKDHIRLLLNTYARIPYEPIETGGTKLYLLMVVTALLGVVFRKQFLADNENNKHLFYMMAASTLLTPVMHFHPVVMRLSFYFFIFMIIYIPNLMETVRNRAFRTIGTIGYVLIGLIEFFTSTIHAQRLDVYKFFWQ